MASSQYRERWLQKLLIATLNNNTTSLSSIECEANREFHQGVPHNFQNCNLKLRFNSNVAPATNFADKTFRRTKFLYDKSKKNVMQSSTKHKWCLIRKPKLPFQEKVHRSALQPEADHQRTKLTFRNFRKIAQYFREKALPKDNYIVRKIKTNKTRILHRNLNIILKNLLTTTTGQPSGRVTIVLSYRRMVYTPYYGKENLADKRFISLLYTLAPTRLILTEFTHGGQTLS